MECHLAEIRDERNSPKTGHPRGSEDMQCVVGVTYERIHQQICRTPPSYFVDSNSLGFNPRHRQAMEGRERDSFNN